MTNNKSMKINQFKTNLRKNINSLKIGGTNNTQKKTPTHTHQKTMYMRNQLKLQK